MENSCQRQWMADERKRALDCASYVREARQKAYEESRQGHEWACGYWYDQVAEARRKEREHIHNYYYYKNKI